MEAKKQLIYLEDAIDLIRDALEKGDRDLELAISLLKVLASHGGAVDAAPVVHGRWIPHNKGQNNWCECSECNTVGSPFWKRCPVCEAKMDGRSEGE